MLKHYTVNLVSLLDIFVILHFEKFICISACCPTVSSMILLVGWVASVLRSTVQVYDFVEFLLFEGIMLNQSTKVYGFFFISSFMCIFNICLHRSSFYFKGTIHNYWKITFLKLAFSVMIAIMKHTFVIVNGA